MLGTGLVESTSSNESYQCHTSHHLKDYLTKLVYMVDVPRDTQIVSRSDWECCIRHSFFIFIVLCSIFYIKRIRTSYRLSLSNLLSITHQHLYPAHGLLWPLEPINPYNRDFWASASWWHVWCACWSNICCCMRSEPIFKWERNESCPFGIGLLSELILIGNVLCCYMFPYIGDYSDRQHLDKQC